MSTYKRAEKQIFLYLFFKKFAIFYEYLLSLFYFRLQIGYKKYIS